MSAEALSARLRAAQRSHLDGDWAEAERRYRSCLRDWPACVAAKSFLAFLLLQTQRPAEAESWLREAIAAETDHADWHFSLGMAQARQGRSGDARRAFAAAAALDGGQPMYWTNLAAACEQDGDFAAAEQACRQALAVDAACADAHFLLAGLCLRQERHVEARRHNAQGIVAQPAAHGPIARIEALCELDRRDEALALLHGWLAQAPDDPVALHLLAACGGAEPPPQCSADFIRRTFDANAAAFDATLASLRYQGPQWLAQCLRRLALPAAALDALDLGCGTGLAGTALRPYARSLRGVDLSGEMLARAADKGVYDALTQGDIIEFLTAAPSPVDLICCLDTLSYFGDLEPALSWMARALKPGGLLLFSIERAPRALPDGHRLQPCGRYLHDADGVEAQLAASGLKVRERRDMMLREEAGCPVPGAFYCAERLDWSGS
ncbi:tetratricopeptide repeat protein [Chromobacterium alkanivorans]|uniref:tetratricopeptide repeat protein n=1 Tax=Chromobacterium alkanivorans TaxID=1071719 RepID=UPI0019686322|nr:tetratricopeptide repeat protein [Chromobacterium alkanivorans]MBN3006141.1 tetratricopeptide repeat protein [Chromobacterium alkanivorans]